MKWLLFFIFFFVHNTSPAQCSAILENGIFDNYTNNAENDTFNSFLRWVKKGKFSSYGKVRSIASEFDITLPELPPLKGKWTGEKNDNKISGEEFYEYLEDNESAKSKYKTEFTSANPNIITAWKECVLNVDRRGLIAWTTLGGNENEIVLVIELKRHPETEPKPIKITSIYTGGLAKPRTPDGSFPKTQITDRRHEFVFLRKNISRGVTFEIKTDQANYSDVTTKIPPHPSTIKYAEVNIDPPHQKMKDGRVWLTQNLHININSSFCDDCQEYGRLYTWTAAEKACRELGSGWRLPTDNEWATLAKSYGGYFDSENNAKVGQSPMDAFDMLMYAGFNGKLGGVGLQNREIVDVTEQGSYWTSSRGVSGKPTSYTFNLYNKMVFRQIDRDLGSARSVRCVKD